MHESAQKIQENAILIKTWKNDRNDRALEELIPLLSELV